MATTYSSTFPAAPPPHHDDRVSVAKHDQTAFDQLDQLLNHWDRPHRRSYHWMITLDQQPQLIELSLHCQQMLPQQGLDFIRPEGLHLTINRLGNLDEVPTTTLKSAVSTVGERCRAIPTFALQVLPLAGSPGAIRFSVAPWSPLLALHHTTATASGQPDVDPLTVFRPHIGTAYSNRRQGPAPYFHAVREARSLPPAEIMINDLQLVELYRADHQYRWHVIERFPLPEASPPVPLALEGI